MYRPYKGALEGDLHAKVVLLPPGHDPDTFVQAEGRDALLAKVREAQPFIEFLLDAEADGHDLTSVQGKLAYVRKFLPLIVNLANQVERTEYLSELVKRTGIAPSALADEFHKLKKGTPSAEHTAATHLFSKPWAGTVVGAIAVNSIAT